MHNWFTRTGFDPVLTSFVFTCAFFVPSKTNSQVEKGSGGPGSCSFLFCISLALKEMQTRMKCSASYVSDYEKINGDLSPTIGGLACPDHNGVACVVPQ